MTWLGCTRQCSKNSKEHHIRNKSKCLKSKVVKEYINKNFITRRSLYNLQELYTAFKEKYPNVNIGFSKLCTLRPKLCVLAVSKMTHSVAVVVIIKTLSLVNAMDWDLRYKDLI